MRIMKERVLIHGHRYHRYPYHSANVLQSIKYFSFRQLYEKSDFKNLLLKGKIFLPELLYLVMCNNFSFVEKCKGLTCEQSMYAWQLKIFTNSASHMHVFYSCK